MLENPYQPPFAKPPKLVEMNRGHGERMSPREVFGIIVRTIGLFSIVYGLWVLPGMFFPEEGYQPAEYLVSGGPLALMGVVLFFGADSVVSLAYGMRYLQYDDEQPSEEKPANEQD